MDVVFKPHPSPPGFSISKPFSKSITTTVSLQTTYSVFFFLNTRNHLDMGPGINRVSISHFNIANNWNRRPLTPHYWIEIR